MNDIVQEDDRAAEVISRVRRLLQRGASKREAIDVNALLESTLTLLHGEFVRRKIIVEVDYAHSVPLVSGDSVQLQQVLINLLMNAMEAMSSEQPSDYNIKLRTVSDGRQVKVAVSDNGPGVPAEVRANLFQPFFSTKERGLGLGLSICATIAKSYGGEIVIENNADRGATASLTLPAQETLVPAQ